MSTEIVVPSSEGRPEVRARLNDQGGITVLQVGSVVTMTRAQTIELYNRLRELLGNPRPLA